MTCMWTGGTLTHLVISKHMLQEACHTRHIHTVCAAEGPEASEVAIPQQRMAERLLPCPSTPANLYNQLILRTTYQSEASSDTDLAVERCSARHLSCISAVCLCDMEHRGASPAISLHS